MARIRRCHECPHRSTRHASIWDWPHCDYGGGDYELSDAEMNGGGGFCPAGYWAGLTPVDLEAEAAAQAAAKLEREREQKQPVVLAALAFVTETVDRQGLLLLWVKAGFLSAALAEEIAAGVGVDLDAEPA